MKQSYESGLSTLAIIAILAAAAILVALVGTLLDSNLPLESTQSGENQPAAEMMMNDMTNDTMGETTVDSTSLSLDEQSDNSIMNDDEPGGAVESVVPVSAGTFQDYSADKLALAENGSVILFFHAAWCPSCRQLEKDINANLSQIPNNVHILKLDYDTQTELKRQYGVVRQHTMVLVDADGTEIKKLTGLTNTLDQLVGQI